MALTKRVYVDGETIITADNLNAIQDEIISQGVNKVPTTRKINNNALSSDVTLTAASVGAAPTAHASSNTTYGKGTNSNYGHVKLTDSLTDTTTAATGGLALSAKAGADLKASIDDTQKMISVWIETGSTASRAYNKGDYIIYGKYLYVARNDISQGESLTGSNLLSARIGERLAALEKLESQRINNSAGFVIYKKGALVNLSCAVGFTKSDEDNEHRLMWSSSSSETYVTPRLDEKFRPLVNVELVNATTYRRITVRTDGYLYTDSALSATPLRYSGSWLSDS